MSKTATAKTSYSPVLRKESDQQDQQRPKRRNRFDRNNECLGQSGIFWTVGTVLLIVVVAVILIITFVVTSFPITEDDESDIDENCLETDDSQSYDEKSLAVTSNEFGARLFYILNEGSPKNLVVSPFSVFSILAQVLIGAREKTEKEMKRVLQLPCENKTQWLVAFKNLNDELSDHSGKKENHGGDFILEGANRIYIDTGFDVTSDFMFYVTEYFRSQPVRINFKKNEDARQKINDWAEKETHKRIKDLLAPGSISPNTNLVLVNAVYFKAGWLHPFDSSKTSSKPFTLMDGETVDVDMMEVQGEFLSARDDHIKATILKLPYVDNKAHMIIVLPLEDVHLKQVEDSLLDDDFSLTSALSLANQTQTLVRLPKFRIESRHNLKSVLEQTGLLEVFTKNADLSGIAGRDDISVDEIFQKAYIDVNEKGTEAAAATAMVSKSAPLDVEVEFNCNRPFIYFIQDAETELDLFVGKLVNPKVKGTVHPYKN